MAPTPDRGRIEPVHELRRKGSRVLEWKTRLLTWLVVLAVAADRFVGFSNNWNW